jgi:hypothetical protein
MLANERVAIAELGDEFSRFVARRCRRNVRIVRCRYRLITLLLRVRDDCRRTGQQH